MPRFRKKPIVISAEQWFPGKQIDGVVMRSGPTYTVQVGGAFHGGPGIEVPVVDTLEGEMRVSPGDWIITGVKGEVYPCKPDIFAATYEEVADAEASPTGGELCLIHSAPLRGGRCSKCDGETKR